MCHGDISLYPIPATACMTLRVNYSTVPVTLVDALAKTFLYKGVYKGVKYMKKKIPDWGLEPQTIRLRA